MLGLGVMVLLHELGHLLSARLFGVRVEEFGLGQGPLLLRLKLGTTLFSLRLLPLGGFTKMAGMHDAGEPGAYASRSPGRRAAILVSGPAVNLLAASLVLTVASPADLGAVPRALGEMMAALGGFAAELLTGGGFFAAIPELLEDAVGGAGEARPVGRYLRILALIGLYLGLFNLLPMLPLDGGRLVLLALEALRGRPLPPRTVGALTGVGVAFLGMLGLLLLFEDLGTLFSRPSP